jgi:hypothetical protein
MLASGDDTFIRLHRPSLLILLTSVTRTPIAILELVLDYHMQFSGISHTARDYNTKSTIESNSALPLNSERSLSYNSDALITVFFVMHAAPFISP